MTTLLDSAKSMLTDAVMDKAASLIGLDSSSMGSAVGKFLPAIIGGLISKGNTEAGASGLLDIFKNKGLTDLGVDDLMDVIGNPEKGKSMLDSGGDLLGSIFGNNQSGILDKLIGMTGLKKAGGSMLLKFLAPIVMRKLAGMVFKNGWGAKKLSSYLGDQKSSISGLIPGMSGLMGFADSAASKVGATASKVVSHDEDNGGGGGWWKWLLPLLLIAAVLFGLSKSGMFGGDDKETMETGDTTEMTDGTSTTGTTTTTTGTTTTGTTTTSSTEMGETTTMTGGSGSMGAIDISGAKFSDNGDILGADGKVLISGSDYAFDADGNIIDQTGKILVQAANIPSTLLDRLKSFLGKYSNKKLSVDADGNLVDASGTVVVKKGEYEVKNGFYYDKAGNKLGRAWAKIVAAVKDAAGAAVDAAGAAATATKEAMTTLFTGLINKVEGSKTEYSLSNIEFSEEGNRITNFSKNEIEGLAAALKVNADGKIVVRGYTNDGGGDMKNKALSKARANVVHDMLVTLGVKDSQISFKGMGSGDNKIEVTAKE